MSMKDSGRRVVDDQGTHALQVPSQTITASTGLRELQKVDVNAIQSRARGELNPVAKRLREGFVGTLVDGIGNALRGVFSPGGLFSKIGQQAEAWIDSQASLSARTDLLSPLLDYGTAYMETTGGFLTFGHNHGVMGFNQQLGPMRGCRLEENGIRLLDKGLWDIRAQLAFEHTALNVGSGNVAWRVVVLDPAGEMFSQQSGIVWNQNTVTSTIISSVVVPASGYLVQVRIDWIHGSRRLPGGPQYNRLTVQHMSRHTDGNATGAETSPEMDLAAERGSTPSKEVSSEDSGNVS